MTELLPTLSTLTRKPEACTVQAVRFDGTDEHAAKILRWCNETNIRAINGIGDNGWVIEIHEGDTIMRAGAGDWVAKGAMGQAYTVPNEIVESTYDVYTSEDAGADS